MQIDITSVHLAFLSLAACFTSYVVYSFALRKDRPTAQRILNELAALWLSYDALVHGVVVALGMASGIPSSQTSTQPTATSITLVWQNFAQPSQSLLPADTLANLAVALAGPVVGYAALMWWREGSRWREGEMAAAVLEILATVLGFVRFKPERLRDMSPERREAAFQSWSAFFFLNILWIVIPAALLWYNFNTMYLDRRNDDEIEKESMGTTGASMSDEKSGLVVLGGDGLENGP